MISPLQKTSTQSSNISQSTHEGTHVNALSHAVDFKANVNSKVLCARNGRVVEIATHFARGGPDESLRHKSNFICIRHENHNSYSRYFHLNKVLVKEGDECTVGQTIGLSGNTGYSFGPHLHFDVVDMLPSRVFELLSENKQVIPCVPLSFSCKTGPPDDDSVRFALFRSDPLDLSQDFYCQEAMGQALLCHRGGEPSFREKADRAVKMGVRLLIIVDNDEEMRDVLPPLVGDSDHGNVLACWVVFVAKSSAKQIGTWVSLRWCKEYDQAIISQRPRPFNPVTIPIRFHLNDDIF